MNITRDTVRADGLTVGEAMDRDAACLRSLGFDAPDGAKPWDEWRQEYQHKVRDAVLEALDSVDGKTSSLRDKTLGGWRDKDLPELFAAIDRQADIQFNRIHNI